MHQPGSAAGGQSLRFRCHGHRNLRALHHKTLEIVRAVDIGERATCVVGVGADYDPRSMALFGGPVELRLEAAGIEEVVQAEVSPFPSTEGGLVLRVSQIYRGNTFAVGASKAARDLDRRLVQALTNPEEEVRVTLRELPQSTSTAGVLYILLTDGGEGPTSEERRALLASSAVTGPRLARLRPWVQSFTPAAEMLPWAGLEGMDHLLSLLGDGRRLSLGVTLEDLETESGALRLIAAATAAGVAVICASEVSPWLRALVVSGVAARPFQVCGRREGRRQIAELTVAARGQSTLVWWARGAELRRGLEVVAALRGGQAQALIARDAGGLRELFSAGSLEHCLQAYQEASTAKGEAEWVAVVEAAVLSGDETQEALPEAGLLRALLREEVPVKTLARAIAAVSGRPKREAYGALLALQGMAEDET